VLAPFLSPVMSILVFSGVRGFYTQQREGHDGNDFGYFKFAATLKNSPST
jgi:lipopolysaccharide/colanic/teichoic acid biosynthesis glycosyltransferase